MNESVYRYVVRNKITGDTEERFICGEDREANDTNAIKSYFDFDEEDLHEDEEDSYFMIASEPEPIVQDFEIVSSEFVGYLVW